MSLAEMLADAEASYHLLVTGKSVREFVDQNGEKVAYTVANSALLAAYILTLQNKISAAGGTLPSIGPMRVYL